MLPAQQGGDETHEINNARSSAARTSVALSSQEKLEQSKYALACSQVDSNGPFHNLGTRIVKGAPERQKSRGLGRWLTNYIFVPS